MCALRPEGDIGYTTTSLYLTSVNQGFFPCRKLILAVTRSHNTEVTDSLMVGHTQLLNMSAENLNSGHCACSVSSLFFF